MRSVIVRERGKRFKRAAMMTFPLGDSAAFVVIEPGNLRRMKAGRPLEVKLGNGSSVMVAFVPDMVAFLVELGLDAGTAEVARGEKKEVRGIGITPEEMDRALKAVAGKPEVER